MKSSALFFKVAYRRKSSKREHRKPIRFLHPLIVHVSCYVRPTDRLTHCFKNHETMLVFVLLRAATYVLCPGTVPSRRHNTTVSTPVAYILRILCTTFIPPYAAHSERTLCCVVILLMVDSVAAMWKIVSAHSRLNLSRTFFENVR